MANRKLSVTLRCRFQTPSSCGSKIMLLPSAKKIEQLLMVMGGANNCRIYVFLCLIRVFF